MSVLVTLLVIVLALSWAMSTYTRVVGLRKQVLSAWRQIDAQLKRRHDLVSKLLNAVKTPQTLEIEGEILDALTAARTRAAGASGPADAGVKEDELTDALERLFVLAERRPQLTARDDIRRLLEELNAFPKAIDQARVPYNTHAAKYNAAIGRFPGNVIAGFASFKAAQLFVKAETN